MARGRRDELLSGEAEVHGVQMDDGLYCRESNGTSSFIHLNPRHLRKILRLRRDG